LVIRREGFSPSNRYSCLHSHPRRLHPRSRTGFHDGTTLPYPSPPLNPQQQHPHPSGHKDHKNRDAAAQEAKTHTPKGVSRECRGFGGVLKPRYIVGAESLDQ
jgi:hypothetical protein